MVTGCFGTPLAFGARFAPWNVMESARIAARNAHQTGSGRAGSACAGILADRLLGEPPVQPHPVAAFGSAMRGVERTLYRDSRVAGAAHAGIGLGLGALGGWAIGSTTVATGLAVAGRSLGAAAGDVATALEAGELDQARLLLGALAGRDAENLDEKQVARAVVESVGENTVDAVVAPALWGAAAGAPGALGYRAVNTLDAMVGHHSPAYERYGWASARLDDLTGWVPARVTAGLVAVVRPKRATAVWHTVRRDAPAHPSPNAGVAEAAFAAALGLRLGGANSYAGRIDLRPALGDGRPAEIHDIGRAVALSNDVGLALAGVLGALAVVAPRRSRRRRR